MIFSNLQHDGMSPQNYKEKNAFKQMIREGWSFFSVYLLYFPV